MLSAPRRGNNSLAQGNRPGKMAISTRAPCKGNTVQTVLPLQGVLSLCSSYPGRCPGLGSCCPFVAQLPIIAEVIRTMECCPFVAQLPIIAEVIFFEQYLIKNVRKRQTLHTFFVSLYIYYSFSKATVLYTYNIHIYIKAKQTQQ